MTQILPTCIKCPICGCGIEGYDCLSLFVWRQDLDLRKYDSADCVDYCYNCNYVSRNVPKRIPSKVKEIVLSREYQNIFRKHEPIDVQVYLAQAFLDIKMNQPAKVIGYNYLRIAWYYDDETKDNGIIDPQAKEEEHIPLEKAIKKAIEYRKIAIKYYEKASDLDSKLILIDLLRRTSQFEKALKIIKQTKFTKKYNALINTQKMLIDKKDIEAHQI